MELYFLNSNIFFSAFLCASLHGLMNDDCLVCALGRAVRRSKAGGKSAFFIVCDRHKKEVVGKHCDSPTTFILMCYQLQLDGRNRSFHPRADMGSPSPFVRGLRVDAMLDNSI